MQKVTTYSWVVPDQKTADRALKDLSENDLVYYVRVSDFNQKIRLSSSFFKTPGFYDAEHKNLVQIGVLPKNQEAFLSFFRTKIKIITEDVDRWAAVLEKSSKEIQIIQV